MLKNWHYKRGYLHAVEKLMLGNGKVDLAKGNAHYARGMITALDRMTMLINSKKVCDALERENLELRRQLTEKPSIPEYPSWAKYIAMDEDGEWYAYEFKPAMDSPVWCLGFEFGQTIPIPAPEIPTRSWKTSLHRLDNGRFRTGQSTGG
jgi:hypothetical protein